MARFCRRLARLLRAIKGEGYLQAEETNTEDLAPTKPYVLRRAGQAYLEIISDSSREKGAVRLKEGFTVGRAAHCHLRLADQEVSRVHAQFVRTGLYWEIVDQGSTNGSLINGKRVARARLKPGDRIEIGQTVLIYQER